MNIDAAAVRECLKSYDFEGLFREHLGWDNHRAELAIPIGTRSFTLQAVAQKRGFTAFRCDEIPDRRTRLAIDRQVSKSAREHFIIYADETAGEQVWQWVRREPGRPLANRDHRFNVSQSGVPLIQRLDQLAVSMDEEETITLPDVSGRARAAFDVDKITKKFYDRFKKEHDAFLKLVTGIGADADLQWYTSVMLNRLMFVYFIQKKGFLDGDTDYLRNRLAMVREARGKDKFQSFYRYFLLRLFHDGLGKSPAERDLHPEMERLLGRVPFLNGGFFEVHQIEERNAAIDIPDKAFEKLFDFFDQYRWHLDERPLRDDNEINPDVVGYIFEKYINQKQMGAYYTKEDITEYISKNTIIPFLFDAAARKCPIAFEPDSALWRLFRDDPDRYIYPAVRHGVIRDDGTVVPEADLPDFVQTGMHDPQARMHDNRYNLQQAPAGDPLRLVTETWREYVCRRERCLELRTKLAKGEVQQINDLITLNLDIWQFARDAIVNAEGPELLRAFWRAIESVTVLDPTCGSGAFLFAALRILETLYSDCLERMARFVEDIADKPHHPEQFSDFRKVLDQIAAHPNERYFVFKSIIVNNLFGVDIMEEAVEICKLRLFLKLVAQVDAVEQIEPLPDIDFNIRAGNTLVGYATADQVRKAFTEERTNSGETQGKLMLGSAVDDYRRFEDRLLTVDTTFRQFRAQQTTHGGKVTHADKLELRRRLAALDAELDRYQAAEYGITENAYNKVRAYEDAFAKWKSSHEPFHWCVEFYGIMHAGGFDVIIGNPPYVEYRKVTDAYQILESHYETATAKNLYAFCVDRSGVLLVDYGHFGMIIPSSAVGLDETACLRGMLASRYNSLWYSTYAIRPAKLFEGVDQRLCIILGGRSSSGKDPLLTTCYRHWHADERSTLFATLFYARSLVHPRLNRIAQVGGCLSRQIVHKMEERAHREAQFYYAAGRGGFLAHYHRSPRYWIRSMDFEQYFRSPTRTRSVHHFRDLVFSGEPEGRCVCAIFNSTLFFFWFMSVCNGRNLTGIDVGRFPVGAFDTRTSQDLSTLFDRLMEDYRENSFVRKRADCEYQEFRTSLSKPIIDEIDAVLAEHYGFTDEELDFIINYDSKYRVGADTDEGEED